MQDNTAYPRIEATGMGVISSLGCDVDSFWKNIASGVSGIKKITRFDTTEFPSKVGGEISNWDPTRYIDPKEAKRTDRFTQFALAAADLAIQDSQLDIERVDSSRFGILIGSGIGGMETIEIQVRRLHELGPRKVSPFMIPMLISNIASGLAAIRYKAKGPNYGVVSACTTASNAIGDAVRMLRLGEADIMMAGGSEAAVTPLGFAGFCNMKAMSTVYNDEPERASRPFDAKRDGFVMGEGAGVILLETLEHAVSRGAPIYCELGGHAASCDAYHMTSPDPDGEGLAICMRNAVMDAGLQPEDVDYINAHGTSTPYNDKTESKSIRQVFGDHCQKLQVSSSKSMTGHLLGAAGGIEAVICIKAIQDGCIPPTINYENPDPECDLNYVPNMAIDQPVRVACSNNLGFGGHNATLVFKRYENSI